MSSTHRQHLIEAGVDPDRVRIFSGLDPDRFVDAALRDLGVDTVLLDDPIAQVSARGLLMADQELGRRLGATAQREALARHSWNAHLEVILSEEPMRVDHRSPWVSVAT
jgi:hypothetical protein